MSNRIAKIEWFKDKSGRCVWHLKATNGQVVCQGEAHRDEHDVTRAIQRVRDLFAGDVVIVPRATAKRSAR